MRPISVFLSGGIEGLSDHGETWRETATQALENQGYDVINPALNEKNLYGNEIVAKNIFLQNQADLLLVEYLIPGRAYIGTDFELTMAKVREQPAVIFAHESHASRVYLKYLATALLPNLHAALDYIFRYYRF